VVISERESSEAAEEIKVGVTALGIMQPRALAVVEINHEIQNVGLHML
jgi:hypothetical protein